MPDSGTPEALTRAAWAYAVAWDDSHPEPQADDARLWDVLYMAGIAASNAAGEQLTLFDLYRVPNDKRPGFWCEAEKVTLGLTIGPGDQGEPVITIMCIEEDGQLPLLVLLVTMVLIGARGRDRKWKR